VLLLKNISINASRKPVR